MIEILTFEDERASNDNACYSVLGGLKNALDYLFE